MTATQKPQQLTLADAPVVRTSGQQACDPVWDVVTEGRWRHADADRTCVPIRQTPLQRAMARSEANVQRAREMKALREAGAFPFDKGDR